MLLDLLKPEEKCPRSEFYRKCTALFTTEGPPRTCLEEKEFGQELQGQPEGRSIGRVGLELKSAKCLVLKAVDSPS